jgi:hypothetical protein
VKRALRRAAFVLATLLAVASASTREAGAQALAPQAVPGQAPAARYAGVTVDVARLRALGLGPTADVLGSNLQAAMRAAFADRTGPGPRLVVRITGLSLNAYTGSDRSGGSTGSGTNNDYLEGEALVVGSRGEILARHPQLLALPASFGGAWYTEGFDRRRLAVLADYYAQWLRRAL